MSKVNSTSYIYIYIRMFTRMRGVLKHKGEHTNDFSPVNLTFLYRETGDNVRWKGGKAASKFNSRM